jgi:hypothetical protein
MGTLVSRVDQFPTAELRDERAEAERMLREASVNPVVERWMALYETTPLVAMSHARDVRGNLSTPIPPVRRKRTRRINLDSDYAPLFYPVYRGWGSIVTRPYLSLTVRRRILLPTWTPETGACPAAQQAHRSDRGLGLTQPLTRNQKRNRRRKEQRARRARGE